MRIHVINVNAGSPFKGIAVDCWSASARGSYSSIHQGGLGDNLATRSPSWWLERSCQVSGHYSRALQRKNTQWSSSCSQPWPNRRLTLLLVAAVSHKLGKDFMTKLLLMRLRLLRYIWRAPKDGQERREQRHHCSGSSCNGHQSYGDLRVARQVSC